MIRRFSWATWCDTILPAFEEARDTASLEPLRCIVPSVLLSEDDHILRGRRYLLFGPDERKLIGTGRLLTAALTQASSASFPCENHARELAMGVIASGRCPERALRFSELLEPDHGLPKWMQGDLGPSLVARDEVEVLLDDLRVFATLSVVEDDEGLEVFVRALDAFVRAEPEMAIAWIHHGR